MEKAPRSGPGYPLTAAAQKPGKWLKYGQWLPAMSGTRANAAPPPLPFAALQLGVRYLTAWAERAR